MEGYVQMGLSPTHESRHYGMLLLLLLALVAYAAIGLTLKVEPASQDHVDRSDATLVDRGATTGGGEGLQRGLALPGRTSP
jgi:hypothetical protein